MLKGVCVVMFWCFEQGSLMQGYLANKAIHVF